MVLVTSIGRAPFNGRMGEDHSTRKRRVDVLALLRSDGGPVRRGASGEGIGYSQENDGGALLRLSADVQ